MGKYRKYFFIPLLLIFIASMLPLASSESSEEFYMLSLINNERKAQGLSPLTMNSALSSAARAHSQDMINRSFFNHVNPDGLTPSDRARNAGYNFIALGENICGNPSIDAGHSSLMGSPAHRANILNPSYKEVGIGIIDGGPYGKMITQLFGTQQGEITSPSKETPQEVEGKPDIIVEGVTVSGKTEVGNQIIMKITLTNIGKKNAGSFSFAIFEGSLDNGKILGKSDVSSLYVGNKITFTLSWIPQMAGNYTIYFVPDYGNSINEENENNNVATYVLNIIDYQNTASSQILNTPSNKESNIQNITNNVNSKPDISISINELSYKSTVYESTPTNIYFRVKNIGNIPIYGVPIKFYVNGNLKSSSNIPQIPPSSFSDFNIFLTFTSPGEYLIEAKVDPENTIEELSKSNNNVSFKVKVIEKSSNFTNDSSQKISSETDLLIYPYYLLLEEQENGDLLVTAKIKNKGETKVENVDISFYNRGVNGVDTAIEKINISIYPNEIIQENIIFKSPCNQGEIIVIIDEDNKIIESDEGNNIATKSYVMSKDKNISLNEDNIINTTPNEVNASDFVRITMKLKDTKASNAYINYIYESNESFRIAKMNYEGNGSYFIDINSSNRINLEYYFEVDTNNSYVEISPSGAPNELYRLKINERKSKLKEDKSILESIKSIFSNIL